MNNNYSTLLRFLFAVVLWGTGFVSQAATSLTGKPVVVAKENKPETEEGKELPANPTQAAAPARHKKAMALNSVMAARLNQALSKLSLPKEFAGTNGKALGATARESVEMSASADSARGYFKDLDEKNRYFQPDQLSGNELMRLPVGLKYDAGDNTTVELALVKGTLYEEYAELSVFLRVKFPGFEGAPTEIFMGADKLKFSYEGGIIEGRLVLLGDVAIPLQNMTLVLRGSLDRNSGNFANMTYAEFGCSEYKGVSVEADLIFGRNILLPYDPATSKTTSGEVTGNIKVFVKNFNDLFIGFRLPPFAITGFERIGYLIDAATFDFSDKQNPRGVALPEKSRSALPNPDSVNTWRGVYLNEFRVMLPPEFKKRNTTERSTAKHEIGDPMSLGARHVIIDRTGFTGEIYATNVYGLQEGSASGWSMSLDLIQMKFESNQLIGGSLGGKIALPISSDTDTSEALGYYGMIQKGGNYLLTVNNVKQVDFGLFKARGTLAPNSSITLAVRNDRFRPEATLHGTLGIYTNKNGDNSYKEDSANAVVKFKGITFKTLVLRTEKPYMTVEYMGYDTPTSFGNFPVSIGGFGISIASDGARGHIGMKTDVGLMEGGKIGASGGFALKFKLENQDDEDNRKWKFDGIELTSLGVRGTVGPLTLSGSVERYDDDPVLGTGFLGCLSLDIKTKQGGESKLKVAVRAQFGRAPEGYRYWSTEGLAQFSPGIPIMPSISINAFGGGAYHHMKQVSAPSGSSCGSVLSAGIGYEPTQDIKLGFKAVVGIKGIGGAFSGTAGFEMVFNNNWGINSVGFFGEGQIAVPVDALAGLSKISNKMQTVVQNAGGQQANMYGDVADAVGFSSSNLREKANKEYQYDPKSADNANTISFDLAFLMDFENDMFHGDANVYVNLTTANLVGIGPKGKAGWMSIHFSKEKWYIHVGTPRNPMGAKIGLGSIASAQLKTYLMIGQDLPGPVPPPDRVLQIVGMSAKEYNSKRNPDILEGGDGFAFGISFEAGWSVSAGISTDFYIGTGFDIMLVKTQDITCPKNNNAKLGANGWYASGNVYVAVYGSIGLKFGFIKIRGISVSIGALVLAELPNPSHFYGKVKAEIRVLRFKAKLDLKVDVGKTCK